MADGQAFSEPFPMLVGFESRKAAQVAAYFALKNGGKIEKLKLIKLMYLSERESMSRHNHPMFYDEYYSLKDGPICSNSLNAINGMIDQEAWSKYVARAGNIIIPVESITRDDMDEVSNAEVRIIEDLWVQFGKMTASQIRNYTHLNCSEYMEVKKNRLPISYKDVYVALGKKNASDLADNVSEYRHIEAQLRG